MKRNLPFYRLMKLGDIGELFAVSEPTFIVNDQMIYQEYTNLNPKFRVLMFEDLDSLKGVNLVGGELYKKRLTEIEAESILYRVESRVGSQNFLKQL